MARGTGSDRGRPRRVNPGGTGDGAPPRPGAGDDAGRMEEWRRRIDVIDDDLLRLLNDRARSALEIGRIKKRLRLPVYIAEREAEILARLRRANQGPLEAAAIRRLFERIIDESRSLERHAAQDPPAAGGDAEE